MSVARRTLLRRAAAWAAAGFAAAHTVAKASTAEPRPLFASDPFALGVASGDPTAQGATIWTRLIGPGLAPLEAPLRVNWEVSETESFSRIVRAGGQTAAAASAHSAHVDVDGLRIGREYFYRFFAGETVSRIGRFVTLPDRADRFRVALAACQHWEHGFFSAYADMIREMPDLVLHVGDYIYEKSFGAGPHVRRFPDREPTTIAAYRMRHALYKTDPHLQSAHAAAAWCVAPDDHELENDYAGAFSAASDSEAFLRRRASAYRAYLEHMPISLSRLTAAGVRFHGKVQIGGLANLYLLDTRQHRSPQPGAPDGRAGGAFVARALADSGTQRSMLGPAQERWLYQELTRPQPRWTLVAQQTLFAPLQIEHNGEAMVWSDLWDGYPQSRAALLDALSHDSSTRALILSGDVHSFWRNAVMHGGRCTADEIVTSCLASRNAPDALLATAQTDNPHVRFLDNAHSGYTLIALGRDRVDIAFRAVRNLADPNSEVFALHLAEIEHKNE